MVSTHSLVSAQKRLHPRFSALSPAMVVNAQGLAHHCLVENLSSGGASLTSAMALAVGEHVRLLLQLPGRAPFSLGGRIVRHHGNRPHADDAQVYGIAFDGSHQAHHAANWSAPASVQHTVADLAAHAPVQESLTLVVHSAPEKSAALVHDLMRTGRRAIAVTTALDAIEWLLDGSSHFSSAVVDIACARTEGCDFLAFLADEYPEVRRVVLHDGSLTQKSQSGDVHGVLTYPWTDAQLADLFAPAR
jgi:hypothetical protein